ncbi:MULTISPECIES: hypothetical protein [unclassified Endozoicomonas]|uniref:hypothetical protein n=1 Tax=unclassified Endozoicomonas TaxID=2644528 RepID=UPI0021477B86|nr:MULTISPECIES: hypothetical protein [unclassified Endozoicomonas]
MDVKKTVIFAVFAGLACTHASSNGDYVCGDDTLEYLTFKLENHTSEDMLLDMGHPKYGIIEGGRTRYTVFSQGSITLHGCNGSILAGFETYVHLYGEQYRQMFDWHINMPLFKTDNSISFNRYEPKHTCDVTYSYEGHGSLKMQAHQSFPGDMASIVVACHD